MGTIEVTRTYLELVDPGAAPAPGLPDGLRLDRTVDAPPSLYRYLYGEVGRAHRWTDRLGWSDDAIRAHLATPGISLWVLSRHGVPVGWFELRVADGDVEIAYFGLLPEFLGRGWGRLLLEHAIAAARGTGAGRIWLHTCTLDHPAALPNYLARGFRPFREERYVVTTDP